MVIAQQQTPPKPSRPSQSTTLTFPILARILSWPIAHKQHTSEISVSSTDGPVAPASPTRTPVSPSRIRTVKKQILTCSSGEERKTHPQLVDANPTCKKEAIIVHVTFEVRDGVNTKTLLAYARGEVLNKALSLGGDTMLNERWTCNVCTASTKGAPHYKVSVTYEGTPARTERRLPDPSRPVCLDQAQGIPGLMTILSRESHYEKSTARST